MHESDKHELRRTLLRVLQKDFHALSLAQFQHWAEEMLDRLDNLTREVGLLSARVAELEQRLAQREARGAADRSGTHDRADASREAQSAPVLRAEESPPRPVSHSALDQQ